MILWVSRTVFVQPDPEETSDQLRPVVGMLEVRYAAAAAGLVEAEPDIVAYADYPATLAQDRLHQPVGAGPQKVRTPSNVVGIFPDDQSVLGLVGAVLAEAHDDWQTLTAATYQKDP